MLNQLFEKIYKLTQGFFKFMMLVLCVTMAAASTRELLAGRIGFAHYGGILLCLVLFYTVIIPLLMRVLDQIWYTPAESDQWFRDLCAGVRSREKYRVDATAGTV